MLYLLYQYFFPNFIFLKLKLTLDMKSTTIKLDKLKIENFKRGIGIAEKTYKTRSDCWGGDVNRKSLFLTLGI